MNNPYDMDPREKQSEIEQQMARDRLNEGLRRRATSLEEMNTVRDYVRAIYDEDRTLEVDRGVMATIVVWGPILALLIALAVSPQGKDLLDQFRSDAAARYLLLAVTAMLNVIATLFSTHLIAGWFFPRVARAASGLYWPRIPGDLIALNAQERWEVFRWSAFPVILTIPLPLAFLAQAAFGWPGWWSTLILVGWLMIFSGLTIVTILGCTRAILATLSLAGPACCLGIFCLAVLGVFPVWCTFTFTTPIAVMAAVISWLLIIHAFTFFAFISRYEATKARTSLAETEWKRLGLFTRTGVPRVLWRHATLLIAALLAFFVIRFIPQPTVWMWRGDGRLVAFGPVDREAKPEKALPVAEALTKFAGTQQNGNRRSLVLVTAAGGGIRAAYWTAAVLSSLQDQNPEQGIDRRIFAISAVSGGALGASAYKALTYQSKPPCKENMTFRACADAFLKGDFVGANVLTAITSEPLQVIFRGRLPAPTRDGSLQDAWSYQWSQVTGDIPLAFSGDFDALFKGRPTPALLLNGTSMRTGRRTIASNLDVSFLSPNDTEQRADCPQEAGILNPAQYLKLSVSAAALTSARFPYVTPAGLLPLDGKEQWLDGKEHPVNCWAEIVDGGYVDNEGIITMRELLHQLVNSVAIKEGEESWATFAAQYRVIVLRLSSQASPVVSTAAKALPDRDAPGQLYIALNNQMNATGHDLVRDFKREVESLGGCMIELNALYDDAPLGWSLSERSRNRLNAWLDGPQSTAWSSLYGDDVETNAPLLKYAAEVKMPQRLKLVRDLIDGKKAGCQVADAK